MNRLRVATYNVHKCRGMDWRVSVSRVSNVMGELDADLVAAQEIFARQAQCVAENLNLRHVFAPLRELNGEPYGNAVFTRLGMVDSEQFDLSVEGREQRGCVRVAIARPAVQFFALHLGTSFFERRRQAMRLVSDAVLEQARFKGARIVAGDFNEWTRGLATQMLSRCLRSADVALHLRSRRTYPGIAPVLHLDHVYYDPEFHLASMDLHRTAASLAASDHLPLVAEFTAAAN